MSLLPMAFWGLEVPAGDVAISGKPDIPAAYRITMAAIDPSAEPEGEDGAIPRATLKVIRQPIMDEFDDYDSEDSEDFDVDDMERMLAEEDSEEDSEDEEANGGPSDPAKSKKARREAAQKEIQKMLEEEGMDMDEEDIPNGVNGIKKSLKAIGKMPLGEDEDEDEDEDDEDSEDGEIEEFVICTLDPTKNYQQTLDITIGDDERVWFKVSGTHSIHLTGNYVEPVDARDGMDSDDEEDEDDYDLEPDSDEIDEDEMLEDELDELDDLDDPRITEIEEEAVPALVKAPSKAANKNKRAAPEASDEETIDGMIAAAAANGEPKLSKKQQKKLKKNDGAAAAAPAASKADADAAAASKGDKKVQFAKQLEQGPTPTKAKGKAASETPAASAVKTVQGVKIDDKKVGTGPAAKNGDRVSMRYIGKLLKDNKVFDSNTKGKPFSFKLGSGEVIKGWDIGVAGMCAGGERRITIPAHHAYGKKALPGIPASSTLVFDIKLLENKGK